MSEFRTCARLEDLPEDELLSVEVEDRRIALANWNGTIYALEDRCSHEDFPLSDGEVAGGQVTCALHGARFDLESGSAKALPAVRPVKTYECRVQDGEIQVRID